MTNKKEKKIREKKEILYRTERERKIAIRPIIEKLTELQLTTNYEPIKKLFILIQQYIKEGNSYEINIPFPMINKRIKGLLTDVISEEVWVKLEHENF